MTITHTALTDIAASWLLTNYDCGGRLLIEPKRRFGLKGEQPDCMGFVSAMETIVVEVKVSVSDFKADARKPHRVQPETGVGAFRYFLTPYFMVEAHEVPEGWGLLYHGDDGVMMAQESERFHRRNLLHELALSLYLPATGTTAASPASGRSRGTSGAAWLPKALEAIQAEPQVYTTPMVRREFAPRESAGAIEKALRLSGKVELDSPGGAWAPVGSGLKLAQ